MLRDAPGGLAVVIFPKPGEWGACALLFNVREREPRSGGEGAIKDVVFPPLRGGV